MKIGNVDVGPGVGLAPMAGVTDLPFRLLCREQGCSFAVTEMVSAKAVWYGNRGTAELLKTVPEDRPLAVQLFGADPEIVGEIAERLSDGPWDVLDFNMGCPVPKVVNNGEGSALMKTPELAAKVVSAMARRSKKPVTVKIRAGWNEKSVNAAEVARRLEDAGAAALTVHGRTREQYYSGKADRSVIRAVKEAVSIPVFGNGDIFTAEDAAAMLSETGCDGIMAARGAEGNPWLFREIRTYLETGRIPEPPTAEERRDMALRHLRMQTAEDGPKMGVLKLRRQLGWYLKGIPNAAQVRNAVNLTENADEIEEIIRRAFS